MGPRNLTRTGKTSLRQPVSRISVLSKAWLRALLTRRSVESSIMHWPRMRLPNLGPRQNHRCRNLLSLMRRATWRRTSTE